MTTCNLVVGIDGSVNQAALIFLDCRQIFWFSFFALKIISKVARIARKLLYTGHGKITDTLNVLFKTS
jgi:hypothetical protein